MIDGIINVYKEPGYTSHDVVAKLRGILKQKKIGHTGTLDPDATGVLPVCLGKGTKLCDMLTETDKVYQATLLLGTVTDTQDISGTVLEKKPVCVGEDKVRAVIDSFVGEYQQIPPMYSAIKVGGKKLYELARAGIEIERKARKVYIHQIEIIDYRQSVDNIRVTFSVHCSKGTYIRTLCHDIGQVLGCGGCMETLVRTSVGRFSIEEALTLKKVDELFQENRIDNYIIKVDQVLADYPKVNVKSQFCRLAYNGNTLKAKHLQETGMTLNDQGNYRVYDDKQQFIGVYAYDTTKDCLCVVKMF